MKMPRLFAACLAAIVSEVGMSSAQATGTSPTPGSLFVKPGDLIVKKEKSGWSAIKVLAVDEWPDGTVAAHCLTYKATISKPSVESLKRAAVLVWHAPIDGRSFREDWELIGNQVPSNEDFSGFVEYLKLTDFPRYISFTGRDSKAIVRQANEHYRKAYALGDEGKRPEAIVEYSKALDLFPLFYEALDNRAFTYMELGQFRQALKDFEDSLRVNPSGLTAFFSRGECLMKLGHLEKAEVVFSEGLTRYPEKRELFARYLEQVRALKKAG